MPMMGRHFVIVRRRAVRAFVFDAQGHCTGLHGEVQPQGDSNAQPAAG